MIELTPPLGYYCMVWDCILSRYPINKLWGWGTRATGWLSDIGPYGGMLYPKIFFHMVRVKCLSNCRCQLRWNSSKDFTWCKGINLWEDPHLPLLIQDTTFPLRLLLAALQICTSRTTLTLTTVFGKINSVSINSEDKWKSWNAHTYLELQHTDIVYTMAWYISSYILL